MMIKKVMIWYLTRKMDKFNKDLITQVLYEQLEFRPKNQSTAVQLEELAFWDEEYKQYL